LLIEKVEGLNLSLSPIICDDELSRRNDMHVDDIERVILKEYDRERGIKHIDGKFCRR